MLIFGQSDEGTLTLWASLDERTRIMVVERYTRHIVEDQMRANDAEFSRMPTQLIQASSSSSIASSKHSTASARQPAINQGVESGLGHEQLSTLAPDTSSTAASYRAIMGRQGVQLPQPSSTAPVLATTSVAVSSRPSVRVSNPSGAHSSSSSQSSLDLTSLEHNVLREAEDTVAIDADEDSEVCALSASE